MKIIEKKAGWWSKPNVEELLLSLNDMGSKSELDLIVMGKNARKYVEGDYSIRHVSQKLDNLYRWLLNNGKKPEFIHI